MGEPYASMAYWDLAYATETAPPEWFFGWSVLEPYLRRHVPLEARIIHIGCGISPLGSDMLAAGFKDIINVDYSEAAIRIQRERHPDERFDIMDVRKMPYEDGAYDVIVDKSTLDSLLCSEEDMLNDAVGDPVFSALQECSRILAPGGSYICISFTAPPMRLSVLERHFKSVIIETVVRPDMARLPDSNPAKFYWVYVCKDALPPSQVTAPAPSTEPSSTPAAAHTTPRDPAPQEAEEAAPAPAVAPPTELVSDHASAS